MKRGLVDSWVSLGFGAVTVYPWCVLVPVVLPPTLVKSGTKSILNQIRQLDYKTCGAEKEKPWNSER